MTYDYGLLLKMNLTRLRLTMIKDNLLTKTFRGVSEWSDSLKITDSFHYFANKEQLIFILYAPILILFWNSKN